MTTPSDNAVAQSAKRLAFRIAQPGAESARRIPSSLLTRIEIPPQKNQQRNMKGWPR
jgi:hypothetical protein